MRIYKSQTRVKSLQLVSTYLNFEIFRYKFSIRIKRELT
jgi:hypothetical protein